MKQSSEGARCLGEHRYYVENFFDDDRKVVHVVRACTGCPLTIVTRLSLKKKEN